MLADRQGHKRGVSFTTTCELTSDLDRALRRSGRPVPTRLRERMLTRIDGSSRVISCVAIETAGCVPRSFVALVIAMKKE
jgi:hypothetical protein